MIEEKVSAIQNYIRIETDYGLVVASERALDLLPGLDSIIFDVDGVLVDVSDSFKQGDRLGIALYFEALGWGASHRLLDASHIDAFKLAGGFNSDWDIGEAVVKFYLFKGRLYESKDGGMLAKFCPTMDEYIAEIVSRGGGLEAADSVLIARCDAAEWKSIQESFDRKRVERLFMEVYSGELCNEVYGFEAQTYTRTGLIHRDKPLLNATLIPESMKLAIATGRTRAEAEVVVKLMEWAHLFPSHSIISDDDGYKKPDPGILRLAVERLDAVRSIYVGDTPDDLLTVRRYDPLGEKMLACSVLTGLVDTSLSERFIELGSDMIADNVNAALAAMTFS